MNQALLTKLSNGCPVFDNNNLYKFLHPSHFYNIVSYLKTVCIQNDDEEECLINEMNMLSINNKDSKVSEYLSNKLIISNLINYIHGNYLIKNAALILHCLCLCKVINELYTISTNICFLIRLAFSSPLLNIVNFSKSDDTMMDLNLEYHSP